MIRGRQRAAIGRCAGMSALLWLAACSPLPPASDPEHVEGAGPNAYAEARPTREHSDDPKEMKRAGASEAYDPLAEVRAEEYWGGGVAIADLQTLDKQIRMQKRLLKSTPNTSHEYPDLLFRLGSFQRDRRVVSGSRADSENTARTFEALVNDPSFSKYARMDEAMFLLAVELGRLGRETQMQQAYLQLIQNYPQSKYIASAYLSFADYYYDKGEYPNALRLYEKVTQFKNAPVYGYALYRLGRCHLQPIGTASPRYDKAMNYFVSTIKATLEGRAGPDPLAWRLRRDARNALVEAYVFAGKPSKAKAAFQKWGRGPAGEDASHEMLARLAERYQMANLHPESSFVYKELMQGPATVGEKCRWQYRVLVNAVGSKERNAIDRERRALEKLHRTSSGADRDECRTSMEDAARLVGPSGP